MFNLKSIRGSSITEYALIAGVVYAALAGMNLYLKRGLQARVKDLTTHFISEDQFIAGNTKSDSEVSSRVFSNQRTEGNTTRSFTRENMSSESQALSAPEGFEDMLQQIE